MFLKVQWSSLFLLLFFLKTAVAYDFTGVTALNFGTAASPFADLTLTNGNVCVAYGMMESANYYVRATSSGSTTTAFQLTNSTNTTYKLNYSVFWAGTTGGSPSYVALSSGVNSSVSFPAQMALLGCVLMPANATLQVKLLSANQILAKQGTYTDTLTLLIVAA